MQYKSGRAYYLGEGVRKICVLTGSRADYGILRPVLQRIKESKKLKLSLIVAGMHLDPVFGLTVREIEKAGYGIDAKVNMKTTRDTPSAMAQSIGRGIIGISRALEHIRPDIFLIPVDRVECLAGAIAAAHMNTHIAHMHGGEVSGSIDESIRHAITKFAHIHFASTEKSRQRIIKLGEVPKNVFNVGAAGLDSILHEPLLNRIQLSKKLGFKLEDEFFLLVFHPVTTEVLNTQRQAETLLAVIKDLKKQTIALFPNADVGGKKIIKVLNKNRNFEFLKIYKSLPHIIYLSLMRYARVMIGNSSSGILEAPSFGLPVVNVGTRQQNRERANNVVDVSFSKNEIKKAIRKALNNNKFLSIVKRCHSPYGNGTASKKIISILESVDLKKIDIQKRITY